MAEPSRFDVLRRMLTPDEDVRPVERQLDTCEMRHGIPSQVCGLPCTRWWISTEEWSPNHGVAPFGRCCNEPTPGAPAAWRHAPWPSQVEEEALVEVTKEKAQAEVEGMRAARLFRGQ